MFRLFLLVVTFVSAGMFVSSVYADCDGDLTLKRFEENGKRLRNRNNEPRYQLALNEAEVARRSGAIKNTLNFARGLFSKQRLEDLNPFEIDKIEEQVASLEASLSVENIMGEVEIGNFWESLNRSTLSPIFDHKKGEPKSTDEFLDRHQSRDFLGARLQRLLDALLSLPSGKTLSDLRPESEVSKEVGMNLLGRAEAEKKLTLEEAFNILNEKDDSIYSGGQPTMSDKIHFLASEGLLDWNVIKDQINYIVYIAHRYINRAEVEVLHKELASNENTALLTANSIRLLHFQSGLLDQVEKVVKSASVRQGKKPIDLDKVARFHDYVPADTHAQMKRNVRDALARAGSSSDASVLSVVEGNKDLLPDVYQSTAFTLTADNVIPRPQLVFGIITEVTDQEGVRVLDRKDFKPVSQPVNEGDFRFMTNGGSGKSLGVDTSIIPGEDATRSVNQGSNYP